MTNRRSTEVRGFVNFPVHLKNTNEGGMYVDLVVVPNEWGKDWMVCSGGGCFQMLNESFMGAEGFEDRKANEPPEGAPAQDWRDYLEELNKFHAGAFFFPSFYPRPAGRLRGYKVREYMSITYLACMTIGSTGWSGDFLCTHADLTEEGKALYAMMQKLYGKDCKIALQTWLDT